MKRQYLLFLVIVLAVLMAGCGRSSTENTTPTPSPRPTEPLPTIKVYKPDQETSQTVTWMYNSFAAYFGGLKEQTAREINRILYERGLDCQIVFVDGGMVDNLPQWEEQIDLYEKNQAETFGHPDILFTGIGVSNAATGGSFLESRMVPLENLIYSAEGKELRDFYTKNEWKQVSLDGKIYTVPRAVYYSGEDENYNSMYNAVGLGLFLSVKEEYAGYFDGFDGTYESLRAIYNAIGNNDLHIVISGFDMDFLYGLLGYSVFYEFPYREDTKTVFSITETEELPFLLMSLYSDMSSGILVAEFERRDMTEDVLAYIYNKVELPREGYREYLLAPTIPAFNANCQYGISATSTQKELAFKILSLCSTDPEILELLYPGLQRETIERRTELLSIIPDSDLAGILLPQTDKKYESLTNSSDKEHLRMDLAYLQMINDRVVETPDGPALNPWWSIESEWKTFSEHAKRYSGLCETVNREIRDWLNGK